MRGDIKSSSFQVFDYFRCRHLEGHVVHDLFAGFSDTEVVETRFFATECGESGDGTSKPPNFTVQPKLFLVYFCKPLAGIVKGRASFLEGELVCGGLFLCHDKNI